MAILESYEYGNLYAGDFGGPQVEVTLKAGVVYALGSVLGRATSGPDDGLCVLVDSTLTNGAQVARYVLNHEVDATAADTVASADRLGEYNEAALIFGGSDTADTHRLAMEDRLMYMRTSVSK